jgi:hypothetical protein
MAANYRYTDFELERTKHIALKSTPDLPFLPDRRLFFVQILAHRAFRRKTTVISASFRVGKFWRLITLATISNMEKNPSGPGLIHMRWHTRNIDSERCVQDTGFTSRACGARPACYKKKAVHVKNRPYKKAHNS